MREVGLAEPYRFGAMSSHGNASCMLIRQFRFPFEYREDEHFHSADHDRLYSWDSKRTEDCFKKYVNKEFQTWAETEKPAKILKFIIEVLNADRRVKWTGFRILGSVNRSNGYPVWSFQVFAKKSGSSTKVYSDSHAPNVKGGGMGICTRLIDGRYE